MTGDQDRPGHGGRVIQQHAAEVDGTPVRWLDRVESSLHHNMKELRPGSVGRTEIRVLFIFDPDRRAVLLVAGDWKRWYDKNIFLADRRYDEWHSEQ
jgi:hypothetical protein